MKADMEWVGCGLVIILFMFLALLIFIIERAFIVWIVVSVLRSLGVQL